MEDPGHVFGVRIPYPGREGSDCIVRIFFPQPAELIQLDLGDQFFSRHSGFATDEPPQGSFTNANIFRYCNGAKRRIGHVRPNKLLDLEDRCIFPWNLPEGRIFLNGAGVFQLPDLGRVQKS